jgi:endoglucanase
VRLTRRALAVTFAVALLLAPAALAGVANRGIPGAPSNPLAGLPWGVYRGQYYNSIYPNYQAARGHSKELLGRIATRPLAFWFGSWFADGDAKQVAHNFIASVTGGNSKVLSQMVVFRLDPWEGGACPGGWNAANQRGYRRWIDGFAAGIGGARVAIVLQPDLAFSTCASSRAPIELVNYAAHKLNALPHTTVYIDGGVHYWPSFNQAVSMLEQAGIRDVRGFALNMSEFDTTGGEIEYGAQLAQALARAGYPNKRFVINTAGNGHGFLNGQVSDPNNPPICHSRSQTTCVTLGIPPTTHVASSRWHLSGGDANLAFHYVDAYMWVDRPWLPGAAQFDLGRALLLAGTTPFP